MTFVRLAFFPGGTAEQYAVLRAALADVPDPPERLAFLAGPRDGGWQVVQVWRSRADLDAFNTRWFLPALAQVGSTGFPAPPEVHDLEAVEVSLPSGAWRD